MSIYSGWNTKLKQEINKQSTKSFFRIFFSSIWGMHMELFEYLIGIVLGLIATVFFNYAPVLQKAGLSQMPQLETMPFKKQLLSFVKNPSWLKGFILGNVGGIPYTIALILVGITIVQPINGFGQIILVYYGAKNLGEKLNRKAKIGIAILVIMPIFITFAAVTPPLRDVTLSEFQQTIFTLIIIGVLIVIGGFIIGRKYPMLYSLIGAFGFAMGASMAQAGLESIKYGGYDIFSQIPLIIENLFQDRNLILMIIYLIFSLFFNIFAVYIMQVGVQKSDATRYNPIANTSNIIFAVAIGLLLFQQQIGSWPFYLAGFGCAIVGSAILASNPVLKKPSPVIPSVP
jgi:hypothetical protein